jgi:hypothetical protein
MHDCPVIKFEEHNYGVVPTYSFQHNMYFTPDRNFLEAFDSYVQGLESYLNSLKLHINSYRFRQRNAGLTVGQVIRPYGLEQY